MTKKEEDKDYDWNIQESVLKEMFQNSQELQNSLKKEKKFTI